MSAPEDTLSAPSVAVPGQDDKGPVEEAEEESLSAKGNRRIVCGVGLGAASMGVFAVAGTIACLPCVVAAPVFLGVGLKNKRDAKRKRELAAQILSGSNDDT